jgi:hypothetical protein
MVARSTPKKKTKETVRGITGISVRGYKSLSQECHIDIRRLTILAGANSSGKSSIMQPVLLLKQTLDAPYDPGPLRIFGPNVKLSAVDQFLSKFPGEPIENTLSLKIELGRKRVLACTFEKYPDMGIDIREMIYTSDEGTERFARDLSQSKIRKLVPPGFIDMFEKIVTKADTRKKKVTLEWMIARERCFFAIEPRRDRDGDRGNIGFSLSPAGAFANEIQRIIHVPGVRGNPERTYRTTAIGPNFPGTFDDYVASSIHDWRVKSDPRFNQLNKALKVLGLTWKIETKEVDDTQVEVWIGRLSRAVRGGARDLVNIADVGFGVSQVLPVVVALLAASPGQLVYIEQPETHLHPRAQRALVYLLADAANRKVRVIVETHSPHILLAVQTIVAEGKLRSERVKLHWFHRRAQDGVTEVTSADLDDSGAFGEWPEDFDDVWSEADRQYLDAAEKRLKRRFRAA